MNSKISTVRFVYFKFVQVEIYIIKTATFCVKPINHLIN